MTDVIPPPGSVMARLLDSYRADADPAEALVALDWFLQHGQVELAAAALDRAYGLDPDDERVAVQRADMLNQLERYDHGLRWRFVPAGTFLMGSRTGDPDERPVHPVTLDSFWMTDVPVSWDDFCRLMSWAPPPVGRPKDEEAEGWSDDVVFRWYNDNKIRRQYCESETLEAIDWHAHSDMTYEHDGREVTSAELFGAPRRTSEDAPRRYGDKPMVAVHPDGAEMLADKLSTPTMRVRLPTEAQWERAARGGLIGKAYPWGDEPPTPARCDFGRFGDFRLTASRALPPNGYGLFAMSGGVAEWTRDTYDALAYQDRQQGAAPAAADSEPDRVARGGSWADAAGAVTVSHRSAHTGRSASPTIGFRLVLTREPRP